MGHIQNRLHRKFPSYELFCNKHFENGEVILLHSFHVFYAVFLKPSIVIISERYMAQAHLTYSLIVSKKSRFIIE